MAELILEAPTIDARTEVRSPDLSILIVTWNSERWIERCLRSIPAACEGLEYEVVVYDNASEDATLETVGWSGDSSSAQPNYRLIESPTNIGFAAGTNRAFRDSRGRYVFLLNPDCELAPRALTQLFQFLEAHPTIAAAAPLLEDESGDSQREFQLRRLPTLGTFVAEVFGWGKLFPKNRHTARYRYRDLDLTEPRRIEQPAAAALLIRREVFDEVGPLDEQFEPAWFEDVDYCRRLADAKQAVYVVPAAKVRHYGGASLEHISFAKFNEVWYRNMWRYGKKWLSAGQAEALRWAIIAGMMLRVLAAAAGLLRRDLGRRAAVHAYSNVLRKAFDRWP
ncbi:MAG TPA: glycosyltransferase family 2 protein [Thermoanaerobaculia bacterium]|jgi:GT2 family glycosyltransferase